MVEVLYRKMTGELEPLSEGSEGESHEVHVQKGESHEVHLQRKGHEVHLQKGEGKRVEQDLEVIRNVFF